MCISLVKVFLHCRVYFPYSLQFRRLPTNISIALPTTIFATVPISFLYCAFSIIFIPPTVVCKYLAQHSIFLANYFPLFFPYHTYYPFSKFSRLSYSTFYTFSFQINFPLQVSSSSSLPFRYCCRHWK